MAEANIVTVAVDAMGGDYAPKATCEGAVLAVNEKTGFIVKLLGIEADINSELSKYNFDKDRIEVIHASEVIETDEPPVQAIKKKKDSSLVKAFYLLRNGEADACVSCGNTGAILVGGQIIAGRIKGIERPALAFMMPTVKGPALLIDAGANVDAKPSNLVQFAQMGYIYMRDIAGIDNPRVGLLNIGEEEEKGNQLVKESFPLIKELKNINFIGSVESRGVPLGEADVVVCDAFAGNLILKMYEGVSQALFGEMKKALMSSSKSKIGAALIKDALKDMMKQFSQEAYGGAPLLGTKSFVIKSHGNSEANQIKNTILQSVQCINEKVIEKISSSIGDQNGI